MVSHLVYLCAIKAKKLCQIRGRQESWGVTYRVRKIPCFSVSLKQWSSGETVVTWHADCHQNAPKRGLAGPSKKSLTRLRRQIENAVVNYRLLTTLTYPATWPTMRQSKQHLKYWAQDVIRWQWTTSCCWVLEFQARGAPHYHLLMDGAFVPYADIAASWHKSTKGLASVDAGTSIQRIRKRRSSSYLCKYLSKTQTKIASAPEGTWVGRTWGVYGDRSLRTMVAAKYQLPASQLRTVIDTMSSYNTRDYEFPGGIWLRKLPKRFAENLIIECGGTDNRH